MRCSLSGRSRPRNSPPGAAGDAVDWANESYGIARRLIYGEWPNQPGPLPASYEKMSLPVVNKQLEKAGARLAVVLNQLLL